MTMSYVEMMCTSKGNPKKKLTKLEGVCAEEGLKYTYKAQRPHTHAHTPNSNGWLNGI